MPEASWIQALEARDVPPAPLVDEVVLLNYPVSLGSQQNERTNDLLREFALMGSSGGHPDAPPPQAHLEELARRMLDRYRGQLVELAPELQRAIDTHQTTGTVRYALLPETRAAILDYARLMEEVDAFCHDAALMTLQPSPGIYALRRWIVEEFVRQYDGLSPRPWAG